MADPAKNSDRDYILLGWRIAGEFGAIIAVPAVLLALLGRWLDARYGTRPLFLILGFAVAATLSALAIHRQAVRFGREYEALGKKMGGSPSNKL